MGGGGVCWDVHGERKPYESKTQEHVRDTLETRFVLYGESRMKRLLKLILMVAVGAVGYHFAAPEFATNAQPGELNSPAGLLQNIRGKQFELVSHERMLYRLDTFSGQTWVLTDNQWELVNDYSAD